MENNIFYIMEFLKYIERYVYIYRYTYRCINRVADFPTDVWFHAEMADFRQEFRTCLTVFRRGGGGGAPRVNLFGDFWRLLSFEGLPYADRRILGCYPLLLPIIY